MRLIQPRFASRAPATVARPLGSLACVVTFACCLPGCELLKGEGKSCDESATTVRQAIEYGDFKSAREWRDYTWKVCGERDKVDLKQLDSALLESERKAQLAAAEQSPEAKEAAQARINAAQSLWLAFDALPELQRTGERLESVRKSADPLSEGLTPGYVARIKEYNQQQYQKRRSQLK